MLFHYAFFLFNHVSLYVQLVSILYCPSAALEHYPLLASYVDTWMMTICWQDQDSNFDISKELEGVLKLNLTFIKQCRYESASSHKMQFLVGLFQVMISIKKFQAAVNIHGKRSEVPEKTD